MRQVYTVHKTEAEAKAAMAKMIESGEIHEMEFPFVARRVDPYTATTRPWAVWISP